MKKLTLLGMLLLLLLSLAACNGNNKNDDTDKSAKDTEKEQASTNVQVNDDKIVAKVNGEEIKGKDYNAVYKQTTDIFTQQGQDIESDEIAKLIKQQTLDSLIGQELIIQDAKAKGYVPTEDKVNQEVDSIKGSYDDEKEFNKVLKENNLTLDELKVSIGKQLQLDSYVSKEVKASEVTKDEIKEFYNKYVATSEDAPKLEEVEPQIKQAIEEQKQQTQIAEIIDKLKKDSKIDILI